VVFPSELQRHEDVSKGEGGKEGGEEKTAYSQRLWLQEMKGRSGCPGTLWQLLLGEEGRLKVEGQRRGKVDESAGPKDQAAVG
jgi:hypothetical protein